MGIETLAIASLGASLIGGGVGFIGAQQSAAAQSQAAEYQAQVARNNQIVAEQDARYATAAGAARAQARDFKTRALVGAATAAQGASGLSLDSPTSTEVREDLEQIGRLDSATIMQDAMLAARSSQARGASYGAQAELADMQAESARTAGTYAGFSSLLSGASSFSDKWLSYKNTGIRGF